ncbi:MAG: UvrD-helicase domain-containing protein [Lewinellaceae bacterium]|nr:UvrD-helicase domain-containing protein [Lewinellaceae bacterium]
MSELPIQIISAGAGSGKTYTLTGKLVDLLQSGIRPSGIIATTFTKKAAAELQERVRTRLLEAGHTTAANELGAAMIGTVHSIGVRLLQRFSFDAGVSPLVDIIAEGDEQKLFNESLAQVLSESRVEQMNTLAERLGLLKKSIGEPYDWRRLLRDITDMARANNFSIEVLETSKRRSWESFEQLLPAVTDRPALQWNNRLLALIDQTIAAVADNSADETKTTRDAAAELSQIRNQLQYRSTLYWYEWVKITKLKPGAKSRDLFEELQEFARSHGSHADFHSDNKAFQSLCFDLAIEALREYEYYKKKRGLIDYTDMEALVARLLQQEAVRETLGAEIDLLLVDEFQDTSPMQLDIFLQLSRLAKTSIWVGDPKQSIYGFRGAEPALMQAIVNATGGIREENILKQSWRSRKDIVDAVNAIFTRAFPDLPPAQVALQTALPEPVDSAQHPALIHWHFRNEIDDRKVPGKPWLEDCIARQIRVLLERQIPVWSKSRKTSRPVQPGDIAILCRSNYDCARLAESLHRAGLKAAIARASLLETAEARLVLACLKYLVTPSDHLSIAEILVLSGSQPLQQFVNERLDALAEGTPLPHLHQHQPLIQQLHTLRPSTAELSASEILDLLLSDLNLRHFITAMGNAVQRLDNTDRLRHYALEYESACQRLHSAATLSGFLLWLSRLAETGADLQGSGESPETIRVTTYHKSKGLEFPVTICHSLDVTLRENIWGVNLESEREHPDLNDILGGRWLRLWMNPYADQIKSTDLEATLQASKAWSEAIQQARQEEARLLYVGLTRARDYLIFPTTVKPTNWLNRVYSQGNDDATTLDPASDETPFVWNGRVIYTQIEHIYQGRDFPSIALAEKTATLAPSGSNTQSSSFQAYEIDPFTEGPSIHHAGTLLDFAPALETADGVYEAGLERAIHRFLRSDSPEYTTAERLQTLQAQLAIHQVEQAPDAQPILTTAQALQTLIATKWGNSEILHTFPLQSHLQGRQLSLEVDWLMLHPQGDGLTALLWAGQSQGNIHDKATQWLSYAAWVETLLQEAFPGKAPEIGLLFGLEGKLLMLEKQEA